MKLSQFRGLLDAHPAKPFRLILPSADAVPAAFHITEVAHVQKRFLDCGGRRHTLQTCQLQAWLGPDADHRLAAGKMASILDLAAGILPDGEDLEVEIEYEDGVISQYPVSGFTVADDGVTFQLTAKRTDCLAKDVCLPALPMAGGCCGPSCGCGPA